MNFFDVFQATSLIIFLALFIGRSLWLRFSGIKIFIAEEKKNPVTRITEMIFIVILILWVYEILKQALLVTFPLLPAFLSDPYVESKTMKIVGVVLISIGLIIFIAALVAFGKSWRIGIDTVNPGELKTSGILALTRNPVFVFILLYFTGTACIYTTVFFTALAISAFGGIHFYILKEERSLNSIYGEKYNAYKKRVRRYL